jgi:hypothetical protein
VRYPSIAGPGHAGSSDWLKHLTCQPCCLSEDPEDHRSTAATSATARTMSSLIVDKRRSTASRPANVHWGSYSHVDSHFQATTISPSVTFATTAQLAPKSWCHQKQCLHPTSVPGLFTSIKLAPACFGANMHKIAAPLLPQRLVLEPACTK